MKKLLLMIAVLAVMLPSQVQGGQDQTNITFSCNIPGLNIPLRLERTEGSFDKAAVLPVLLSHGGLFFIEQWGSKQNMQEMVIDHARLAAFRIAAGLTSTICHELGHAVSFYYSRHWRPKSMHLGWSPASILLGHFDDPYVEVEPICKKDDHTTKSYLEEGKDRYRDFIIGCASGPLFGALSAYLLYKSAKCLYPLPSDFTYIMIAGQNIAKNFANYNPIDTGSDGHKILDAWNKRRSLSEPDKS